MTKEKSAQSLISIFRDIALILGVFSSVIGFGPQILESLDKLIEAKREYSLFSAYMNYGQKLFDDELYSDSVQSFNEALALHPNDLSAQVSVKKARLMYSLDKLQNIDKGEISKLSFEVEFVIHNDPPDIYRYYYVQGNIRYVLANYQRAKESYEKALKANPSYGRALANLGAVLNDLKEHDTAAKTLRSALKEGYTDPSVYNNLTLALYSIGQNDAAVAIAREGLRHFPTSPNIYNELGIALYKLGRRKESISALRTAYVMTPKNDTEHIVQRLVNLSYPLAEEAGISEALSYLQTAKELLPEDPHIYLALARVHIVAKNDLETVRSFERLAELGAYPDPDDLVRWAEALDRLNRQNEASRILYMAIDVAEKQGKTKDVLNTIKILSTKLKDLELIERINEIERSNAKKPE